MKTVSSVMIVILLCHPLLFATESDWGSDIENEQTHDDNTLFEKTKIKNRSQKEYDDKVYKYITGDYEVENNTIELATIHLSDNIDNEDIQVNVISEELTVEGDSYKDSIDIKRNRYKNFVHNDESGIEFSEMDQEFNAQEAYGELGHTVHQQDSRYTKVPDEDVSEIETIDLRDQNDIKEVNVFIEDVNIRVE